MSMEVNDRTNPVAFRTNSDGASEVNSTKASLWTTLVVLLSLYREHDNRPLGFLTEPDRKEGNRTLSKVLTFQASGGAVGSWQNGR